MPSGTAFHLLAYVHLHEQAGRDVAEIVRRTTCPSRDVIVACCWISVLSGERLTGYVYLVRGLDFEKLWLKVCAI
jgi:hypothetical protein